MSDQPTREPTHPGEIAKRDKPGPALRVSETHLRLLVDSVREYALYLLDPSGRVSSWNAGAQRIKGYDAAEIIGEHFSTFFTPEDRADGKPERLLGEARNHGSIKDEGWRMRKDGTRLWSVSVITALYDE